MTGKRNNGTWELAAKTASTILHGQDNAVYSPVCIYECLNALRKGAKGDTARELDELLCREITTETNDDPYGIVKTLEQGLDYTARLATAIWIDEAAKPAGSFKKACAQDGINVNTTDLSAQEAGDEITRWISEQTEGLLSPRMNPNPAALACIASALYFKDSWGIEFAIDDENELIFHTENGDAIAECMIATDELVTCDHPFGTIVECPLTSGGSVALVLPAEGLSPHDVLQNLNAFQAVRDENDSVVNVEVHLPKFVCESSFEEINPVLQRAGFASASCPDLSLMTGESEGLATFAHGARIAIDEDGLEGGSYCVMCAVAGLPEFQEPPEPRVITFDRPFLFVVKSSTLHPLFIGVVTKPQADPLAWIRHDEEESESEDGDYVLEDEEIPGICRAALIVESQSNTYAIVCNYADLDARSSSYDSYNEAYEAYERTKLCLRKHAARRNETGFDEAKDREALSQALRYAQQIKATS